MNIKPTFKDVALLIAMLPIILIMALIALTQIFYEVIKGE